MESSTKHINKIKELIDKNIVGNLKQYIAKNNITYKIILSNKEENILTYAVQQSASFEIIKYITNEWHSLVNLYIPDKNIDFKTSKNYEDYKDSFFITEEKYFEIVYKNFLNKYGISPLSVAIEKNNFKVANFLIANGAIINKIPTGTLKNIINEKNSKYIFSEEFDISENLFIHLMCYEPKILNNILKYYLFNNTFILKFLSAYKHRHSLSKKELEKIIYQEKNKIPMNQTIYRILFIRKDFFYDYPPPYDYIGECYNLLKLLFKFDYRNENTKLFDLYVASRYISVQKKEELIDKIKSDFHKLVPFEKHFLNILEKSLMNQNTENTLLGLVNMHNLLKLKKRVKNRKYKLTNLFGEFHDLGINYPIIVERLWYKNPKIVVKTFGGINIKKTEFQDIYFLKKQINMKNYILVKYLFDWGVRIDTTTTTINNNNNNNNNYICNKINLLNEAIHCNNIDIIKCIMDNGGDVNFVAEEPHYYCISLEAPKDIIRGEDDITFDYLIEYRDQTERYEINNSYQNTDDVINKYRPINDSSVISMEYLFFHLFTQIESSYKYSNINSGVDAVLQTIHQYYYYIPSLVYAIHNDCNTNIIKYIVARGADVNVKSKNSNNTPLGEAIHNNDLDLVKYLMEHKANLKEAIYENELPLNVAIEFGDLEMIDFLIKNGLDINSRKNSYKSWSEVPLGKAAYLGNFELVKTLIEKYGANVNDDVLNSGVCSGNKEIVKYLIECGADINAKGHNRINNNSFDIDPLYHAIFKDYKEIVEYLIDMGAKINMSDTHRDSHLNAAIISHKKNMVKYLINLTITESNCEEYTFTKYAYKLNEYCNNNDKYRQTYLNIKEYLNLYEDHFNINSFIIS